MQQLEPPCVRSGDTGGASDRQRLALVTGRRPPARRAREEPHEPRSHAGLVDNLMVTWEIQHQVSRLPGQLAAQHTTEEALAQVLQDNM